MQRYFCILLLAALCVPAKPTGFAQEPQTAVPGAVPLLKADTHAVAVDVVVTRGQDEPVQNLRKGDFQLQEDGKPQAIDFFEEHRAPTSTVQFAPLPQMPPHVYTNVPAAPLSDSVNVLLLDSLNTPRQDQSFVHQQILDFLRTMKPEARIAIFILGDRLRLVQGFTDDPALLRAALNDPRNKTSPSATNVSRTRDDDQADKDEQAVRQANLGGAGRSTEGIAALNFSQNAYAEFQKDQRVQITLEALQGLGRYLAGIPGRKNLIWFSSQYPIYFFPKSNEKQPFDSLQREFTSEIKATADILTVSKVAVYPINAEGIMNDHPMEAQNDLAQAGRGGELMANIKSGSDDRANTTLAMEQLAADTGGQAIFNTNGLQAALDHVIHNGERYYTLVYTPTNKEMNGQFRRIQVKLDPKVPDARKSKLAYRRGYYADSPDGPPTNAKAPQTGKDQKATAEQRIREAELNPLQPMMGRGMPSASMLLYGVRVEPAARQPSATDKRAGLNAKLTGPVTRYTADFMLDWKQVTLEPAENGNQTARILVELIAYDHDGKVLNWAGGFTKMTIDPPTLAAIQKSGIPAHMELDVPSTERVYLSTGVYDYKSRRGGTLEIPLETDADPAKTALAAKPTGQ